MCVKKQIFIFSLATTNFIAKLPIVSPYFYFSFWANKPFLLHIYTQLVSNPMQVHEYN